MKLTYNDIVQLNLFLDEIDFMYFDKLTENEFIDLQKENDNILNDMYNNRVLSFFKQDEIELKLKTILEMRIIYLYKTYEITLKKIYNFIFCNKKDVSLKKINSKFKMKLIFLENIQYYNEIDEIRKLSNFFKHNHSKINAEILNIKEFNNLKYIEFDNLLEFYYRVKLLVNKFFENLINEINKKFCKE